MFFNPPCFGLKAYSTCLRARCPSAPLSPLAVHWKGKTWVLESDLLWAQFKLWLQINLNSFQSYLGKDSYCIVVFWLFVPHSPFLHSALVFYSSWLKSEFPLHMSLCKMPICPIVPIDSPLKEENIILDAVLIGRPRVCTSPPPWKIWYVNCHGIGLLGRWWGSFLSE